MSLNIYILIVGVTCLNFININSKAQSNMEYSTVSMKEANKMISSGMAKFDFKIAYNEALVYNLQDGKTLVTPLIPFYNSLIIHDRNFLNVCIEKEEFPLVDSTTKSTFSKSDFSTFSEDRYKWLQAINVDSLPSLAEIDSLLKSVLNKKSGNIIIQGITILIGEVLIKNMPNDLKWATFKNIGPINPNSQLIILDQKDAVYYPVESVAIEFEKEYRKFGSEASIIGNLKIMLDFPKKAKVEYIKNL